MRDYILRGTDKLKNFRFFGVNTTHIANIAREYHDTTPVVSAALGRLLSGASMMGAMLKNDTDRVSISIRGDGPIKGLIAEADAFGNVKGYAYEPHVDIPLNAYGKLDVSGAIGNAAMTVMKDIGLKEPYTGQIAMPSGEIAEDLTYYFATSEQTNSVVILGVLVDVDYSIKHSGGIIIQVLPDAKDEAISRLEDKISTFISLTAYLEEGKTIEEIIQVLLEDIDIAEKREIEFKCDCSKEGMERALITLGKDDLEEIASDEQTELVCHFCNSKYMFSQTEIKDLIQKVL